MTGRFRLTDRWHEPRILFGPARIAPFSGAAPRSPMAAPERPEKVERIERRDDDRTDKERGKAVEMAVGQIEKQFGKGSIMRLGGKDAIAPIPAISTGSITLDWALGVGGLPRGRVIEIFGPESSGKTTLALQTIAQAQKLGGVAAFIDAEHALDAAVLPEARRGSRQPARVAAGQRRAGARDCRSADSLQRRGRGRRGLGRRARARAPKSRAKWAMRRWASRPG